jgi:acetylglutamate kinase
MQQQLMDFFKKTGKEEFELFKGIYGQDKEKFAVIKISGATLENKEEEIGENLAFLAKMGIFPVVVHGAGTKLDKKLPNSVKVNGVRVTTKASLPVIEAAFDEIALSLASKISVNGAKAVQVKGIFSCEKLAGMGEVGKIIGFDSTEIINPIRGGNIPIISPIGFGPNGEKLNINADSVAKEVTKVLQPKKYIMLTETGGILDTTGSIMPFINLSSKDALNGLSGGMLLKAKEAKDFLESTKGIEVVITSSENLLPELFTVKGKGTMLKYNEIYAGHEYDEIGKDNIKFLLEDAFGKKLKHNFFDEKPLEIIYEKKLEGLAILKKVGEFNYLDKFAVKKESQGKAIGKSIWLAICQNHPSFIWRANPANPINSFYQKNCDGFAKAGNWIVYWNGIETTQINSAISAAVNKESSFEVGK